jgi:hypothetical protein
MEWIDALLHIQFALNNARSASTRVSPNEYCLGIKPRDPLDLIAGVPETDFRTMRLHHRDMAEEAVASAAITQKFYHDKKHKQLPLKAGDWVMLNLHKGYKVPGHL